MDILSGIII